MGNRRAFLGVVVTALAFAAPAHAADSTKPTVRLTAPANGATVSGGIGLAATAGDNVGVSRVEFYVNTTLVDRDQEAPYTGSWDSGSVANGSYYLTAVAYDLAGNYALSTVTVSVSNAKPSQRVSLLPNGDFESGLTGWGTAGGTLALANDGNTGPKAGLITSGSAGYVSLFTQPAPVSNASAGGVYIGSAWVRSAQAGLSVCLRVREWTNGTFIDSRHSCVTTTTGWQQIAARSYLTTAPGTQIDLDVTAEPAPAGRSFEVDGVTLTGPPAPVAPANDAFSSAAALTGLSGSAPGTNAGATKGAGEPNHAGNVGGHSVWYRWTPSSSGTATISTGGSDFDTLLAAYTGDWGGFAVAGANDDAGGLRTSSISFPVTAGTTYSIAVDGKNGAVGNIKLSWSTTVAPPPPAPPANDYFSSPIALTGGSGSLTGTNVGATKGAGELSHAGNPGGHSVWYSWTAPADGPVKLTTDGSAFDTLLAAYTGPYEALALSGQNDDANGLRTSTVTFTAHGGTTYSIAVDGKDGAAGAIKLAWSQTVTPPPPSPPANDYLSTATVLTGASGSVTGTTVAATKGAGEPNHAGNAGGHSIWYSWTAPADGNATFTTDGSGFDTLLAAYTGDWDTFVVAGANDDGAGVTTSTITFAAKAGVVYSIAVDGKNGASGTVKLAWTQS